MAEGKFVSYLRVSTDKQGRSGLGLEAQRDAVARYLNGGHWKLVAEYVEVESGKRNSRPQLQAAIGHAKATGAKLVIARLDRLARNLHFVSSLQERGVDFVAADMPDANRLTIHIIAAVAEAVGRTISENTKTALAAAKARGVKLGNPHGARALRGKQVGNADAVAKLKADATQRALDLAGIVNTLRSKGVTSVRSLADALNEQGMPPRREGLLQRGRGNGPNVTSAEYAWPDHTEEFRSMIEQQARDYFKLAPERPLHPNAWAASQRAYWRERHAEAEALRKQTEAVTFHLVPKSRKNLPKGPRRILAPQFDHGFWGPTLKPHFNYEFPGHTEAFREEVAALARKDRGKKPDAYISPRSWKITCHKRYLLVQRS
jgi:DNA invertase Pin-like site-specific DNA recombinase